MSPTEYDGNTDASTETAPVAHRDTADEQRELRERLSRALTDASRRLGEGDPIPADTQRVAWLRQVLGASICDQLAIYNLPEDFLLSVVIPVYNEAATIQRVVERVRDCGIPCEIVLVDDASTDGTRELLRGFEGQPGIKLLFHEGNRGKGAALKTGFEQAEGDVVVIQDADTEYDPRDFRFLLQPIIEGQADVVYGSRFSNPDRTVSEWWHRAGNQLITWLSNLSTQRSFTDVETCYKMFRREVLAPIVPLLREKGFGIELELTARLSRRRELRFHERPIRYVRRGYNEGKKIGWRDGVWALWCILRY